MSARLPLALLLAFSLFAPAHAAAQSVAERWRTRAGRAVGELARIDAEVKALRARGAKRDSEEVRVLELKAMLERAFADHLDAKRQKELHRTLPGGDEVFALAIRAKRRATFALNYIYDGAGALLGVRVLSLPESWSALLPGRGQGTERKLFVDPGEHGKGVPPLFAFDLDDAVSSFVKVGP